MANNTLSFEKETDDTEKDLRAEIDLKLKELRGNWALQYQHIAEDLKFLGGGDALWDATILTTRRGNSRVTRSVNLTAPYPERVAAPIRTNPPSISVRCTDKELESITTGVIRGIEKASSAYDAYATAIYNSSACGFGWLRLAIEEQVDGPSIRIKSVQDPTSIMLDPWSESIDGSDAIYAAHHGTMELEVAQDRYGDDISANKEINLRWGVPDGSVIDCTVYWLVEEGCRIVRYIGSKVVYDETITGLVSLPIIPVYGNRVFGRNGVRYDGLVARLRGLNQDINICVSNIMEMVASAPKPQWLVDDKATEGHREAWSNMNTTNYAYLPYNSTDDSGAPIQTPQRMDNQPQTQALQGVADWLVSLQSRSTGFTDAMMGGLESASESGKSLIARMRASESSTAMFVDHLTSSISQMARVIIQMLPVVYGKERNVVMVDEYGRVSRRKVDLSHILSEDVVAMLDVEVESGTNMEIQRAEASEALQGIIQSAGEQGLNFLDLWAETQNLPNGDKVQERLKKIMSPDIIGEQDPQAPHPEAMAALQKADQVIAEKDTTIQQLEGMLTQLQAQVNSQNSLVAVEKYKADLNAAVQLKKAELDFDKEVLKQGGANQRTAAQIDADKGDENDDDMSEFIARQLEMSSINTPKPVNLPFKPVAKVPNYIADNIVDANK
jgi:hypothetical protein